MGFLGVHYWGPIVFNLFINYQDDGIDCTLTKSGDDTKLEGKVDTAETRKNQLRKRELSRLEDWTNKKWVKFNKDKCKAWHVGWNKPMQPHRLGSHQLGCGFGSTGGQ